MKTKSTTISIRVSTATKRKLDSLAKAEKRSKSFLAAAALEDYLWLQEWRQSEITNAMAELDAGEGIPGEEVTAWMKSWGAKNEKAFGKK